MAIRDGHYEGSFTIPTPKGVYQAAGDTNISTDYAYRAENMRTERGMLATSLGTSRAFPAIGSGQPVETLERFHRRSRPDDPDVFVAAAGGAIYTYTMGDNGWVERAGGFNSSRWSCVTYEAVEGEGAGAQTVDILIMSNALDGMIAVFGSDLRVERKSLALGDGYANVKFATLSRHAERIWGTGAPGYPDSVFYSRAYDPFDWTQHQTKPEMGGGVINQPGWDGDAFMALAPFGGYLLAFKKNTVYEIRGTDPSSYSVTASYGTDGPVEERTVCVDRSGVFFLSGSGLGMYDGSALQLLSRDSLYETMRLRDAELDKTATACVCDHKYYLAFRMKTDEEDAIVQNNAVIEFDTERGTFMIRTGLRVRDFFTTGGKVYYTRTDDPFDILRYNDPDVSGYAGLPMESVWETAWMDLGKTLRKRDFVLRFTAESDIDDLPLSLTIITDRREKEKICLLERGRHDYRVKVQNSGIRVKLRIRSNSAYGWRIFGGVQVEYTFDEV